MLKRTLATLTGAGVSTTLQKIGEQDKGYSQHLDSVPVKGLLASLRRVFVFDADELKDEAAGHTLKAALMTAAIGAAEGYDLSNFKLKEKESRVKQAARLALPPAILMGANYQVGKAIAALRSEETERHALLDDLSKAGYAITKTNDIRAFEKMLEAASLKGDNSSRTIIVLNSHGSKLPDGTSTVGNEKKYIRVPRIAELTSKIPGQLLLASGTCRFTPSDFHKQVDAGHITVFSQSGKTGQVASANIPFYSALRAGIRQPERVIAATRIALEKNMGKRPLSLKIMQFMAGKPTISSNKEFSL